MQFISRLSLLQKLILLIVLGSIFWIFEAAVMAYGFNTGDLKQQVFSPVPHEVWQRLLVLFLVIGFALLANYLLNERHLATKALRESEEKFRDLVESSEENRQQRTRELSALYAIAATVSQSNKLENVLNDALDEVLRLEILGDDAYGMMFLLDEQSGNLSLKAQRRVPADHPCIHDQIASGECLCGLAAKEGRTIISRNAWEDNRHTRRWPEMPDHRDICLPLIARDRVLGVMNLKLPQVHAITENDIGLLKSVADQIGIAIENTRLQGTRERAIVEERERIARELHDGLAQLLTYINAKVIATRLSLKNDNLKGADDHLDQLENATQSLFTDVRQAILGLRMTEEVEYGLPAMVQGYATRLSQLSGLSIDVVISSEIDEVSLPVETELQLLRIIQEALTNVRKHATATQARVCMQKVRGILNLTISDDGIGFSPDINHNQPPFSFGLSTMYERAKSVGADFQIASRPGTGTQVTVQLPLKE